MEKRAGFESCARRATGAGAGGRAPETAIVVPFVSNLPINVFYEAVSAVSKPAVSPTSKSAEHSNGDKAADSDVRDTADLDVRATLQGTGTSLDTIGTVGNGQERLCEKISPRPALYGLVRDKKERPSCENGLPTP